MARAASLIVSVAFLLAYAGESSPAHGQTTETTTPPDTTATYGWMGYHLGITAPRGFRAQFGLFNHVHPPHLFRVRLVGGGIRGGGLFGGVEGLYGRTTTWRLGRASLAGGLVVGGMSPLFEDNEAFLGVPLEATIQLLPPRVRSVGLELGLHVNVNLRRSFAGVSAGLVLGKLR